MQVVIEIDDKTYKDIKEENSIYGINNGLSVRITGKVVGAIQNGEPLPKGHGRLIDTDDINQVIKPLEASDSTWEMTAETAKRLMYEAFNRCPTIIKADRSVEDGNNRA